MPAGPVASPPWVAGSWEDTAWEAGSWGAVIAAVITSIHVDAFASMGLSLSTPTDVGVAFAVNAAGLSASTPTASAIDLGLSSGGLSISGLGSV
jgi:hypothetical protein